MADVAEAAEAVEAEAVEARAFVGAGKVARLEWVEKDCQTDAQAARLGTACARSPAASMHLVRSVGFFFVDTRAKPPFSLVYAKKGACVKEKMLPKGSIFL